MSDEFPELTELPEGTQRLSDCQIAGARPANGVMVTRFHETPGDVVVAQPLGDTPEDGWLYTELDPESARQIADELYMQAGQAERHANDHV